MTRYPYCQVCMSAILRTVGNFKETNPNRAIDLVNGVLVCGDHLDIEIVRCAGNPVLAEILEERLAQDEEWGGRDHDDQHELEDWLAFIRRQYDRATAVHLEAPAEVRGRLIKLAALAVAAAESFDRKRARV